MIRNYQSGYNILYYFTHVGYYLFSSLKFSFLVDILDHKNIDITLRIEVKGNFYELQPCVDFIFHDTSCIYQTDIELLNYKDINYNHVAFIILNSFIANNNLFL